MLVVLTIIAERLRALLESLSQLEPSIIRGLELIVVKLGCPVSEIA
jgi:hypothetical protein